MTTTKEQLARVEAELAELKLKIEAEEKPVGSMFPALNEGDQYYFLVSRFDVGTDENLGDDLDRARCEVANAFTDEVQAQACADYLKDRFWFIRKAIEFADGYKFVNNQDNYTIVFDKMFKGWCSSTDSFYPRNGIYMTKENANKFIDWLNIHKPEGF